MLFLTDKNNLSVISYEQQSLTVHDIFPSLPKASTMPHEHTILIKISCMDTKNEDDDSCFTDDDGDDLQFGDIEL